MALKKKLHILIGGQKVHQHHATGKQFPGHIVIIFTGFSGAFPRIKVTIKQEPFQEVHFPLTNIPIADSRQTKFAQCLHTY